MKVICSRNNILIILWVLKRDIFVRNFLFQRLYTADSSLNNMYQQLQLDI